MLRVHCTNLQQNVCVTFLGRGLEHLCAMTSTSQISCSQQIILFVSPPVNPHGCVAFTVEPHSKGQAYRSISHHLQLSRPHHRWRVRMLRLNHIPRDKLTSTCKTIQLLSRPPSSRPTMSLDKLASAPETISPRLTEETLTRVTVRQVLKLT